MRWLLKILQSKSGLTLIELIAAMTILSIISGPIYYLYLNSQVEPMVTSRAIQAQSEAEKAMKLITEDLRKVDSPTGTLNSNNVDCIEIDSEKLIVRLNNDLGQVTSQIVYGVVSNNLYRYVATTQDISSILDSTLQTGQMINTYPVDQFTAGLSGETVVLTVTVNPPNVGSRDVKPISISNQFIPRYSDIRENPYNF